MCDILSDHAKQHEALRKNLREWSKSKKTLKKVWKTTWQMQNVWYIKWSCKTAWWSFEKINKFRGLTRMRFRWNPLKTDNIYKTGRVWWIWRIVWSIAIYRKDQLSATVLRLCVFLENLNSAMSPLINEFRSKGRSSTKKRKTSLKTQQ